MRWGIILIVNKKRSQIIKNAIAFSYLTIDI
jgi:hypothetical protein